MEKRIFSIILSLFLLLGIQAQNTEFETASEAVKNMKVGWNLSNTLDSHVNPGDTWFNPTGWQDWETVWGNPVTKPELMKMMRKAGFGAIRVPVTWFPHMDENGKVDPEWMKRVHEVVDYVIGQGLYCIINVHHDTGDNQQAWVVAEEDIYEQNKDRFYDLWQQIAEEFKDYDEHLLFEGFNEILSRFAWRGEPADFGDLTPYQAINHYSQTFVDAVRATGGNNLYRNLIISTHGATINPHSFSNTKIPEDQVNHHLILSVHRYEMFMDMWEPIQEGVDNTIYGLNKYFIQNGIPVIIGEWGPSEGVNGPSDIRINAAPYEFTTFFIRKMAENNIAVFPWTGPLSYGEYRNMPAFEQYIYIDAILKGYYGDDYHSQILTTDDYDLTLAFSEDNQLMDLTPRSKVAIGEEYYYSKYILELEEDPEPGQLELCFEDSYEETPIVLTYPITSALTQIELTRDMIGYDVTNIYLRHIQEGSYTVKLKRSVFKAKKRVDYDCFGHGLNPVLKTKRKQLVHLVDYYSLWSELNIFGDDIPLKLKDYKGIRLELAEMPKNESFLIKVYGDNEQKEDYLPLEGLSTTIMFNTDMFSNEINRVTLQSLVDGNTEAKVIEAYLIHQDGTEEYSDLSSFWGCEITLISKDGKPNGDANGDGKVNMVDIVEMVNYINGNPSDRFLKKSADMNNDGVIDNQDIQAIVDLIMSSHL